MFKVTEYAALKGDKGNSVIRPSISFPQHYVLLCTLRSTQP